MRRLVLSICLVAVAPIALGAGGRSEATVTDGHAAVASRMAVIAQVLSGWRELRVAPLTTDGCANRRSGGLVGIVREFDHPATGGPTSEVNASVVLHGSAAQARRVTAYAVRPSSVACVRAAIIRAYRSRLHRDITVTSSTDTPSWIIGLHARNLHAFTMVWIVSRTERVHATAILFTDPADPRVVYDLLVSRVGEMPTALARHLVKTLSQ